MISGVAYIVVLVVSVIVIIAGFAVVWFADKSRAIDPRALAQQQPPQARGAAAQADNDDDEDDDGGGRRRRRAVRRVNQRAAPVAAATPGAGADSDGEGSDDGGSDDEAFDPVAAAAAKGKRIGAKKMLKLQMKEQRRHEREALDEQRRARKARELIEEQERLARKQKEAEEKLSEEQAEARRKQELEQQEQRLLDEWKGTFEVVAQGTDMLDSAQQEQQEAEFIEHIKVRGRRSSLPRESSLIGARRALGGQARKIVLLEELAVLFRMKTHQVVERLQALDKNGKLPGVIDDRGKFVYITDDEMDKVSKFIMRRGRVTIDEIAKEWYVECLERGCHTTTNQTN